MAARRVLVIEDDVDIREVLVDTLFENGYDAIGAVDGNDALKKLEAADHPPCLILLDLMMPGMDGRTFRKEQLKRPAICDIPVVVVSAHQAASVALELGTAGHLSKPLGLDALLATVEKHCKKPA